MHLLLLANDDAPFARRAEALTARGHSLVRYATDPDIARALAERSFDALLIDRSETPARAFAGDALALVRGLRAQNIHLPVLVVGASGDGPAAIAAFEAGADDLLPPAPDMAEVEARVQARLRARAWAAAPAGDTLTAGDIVVSPARLCAWRAGRPLALARTELAMLTELVRHADSVVTRAMLLHRVWHRDDQPTTNLVEAHMRRLRMRLTDGGTPDPIKTVRGVGYILRR